MYSMLLLLKKSLSLEKGDFESLWWIYPLLELWHTKWTDLSHAVYAHWGMTDDTSSLAAIAEVSNCPTPSDLQKVDFFDGSHFVNLMLDAHLLNCWESVGYAFIYIEVLTRNGQDPFWNR